ncbi:MAG: peptidoglycan DD-metalloendopeptidase family protein [Deltaproteobacteria bacterium]|nr:peptidoglycan DD-metalloendopeptidase family protein [Deltaproteobacteria bacterium]
MLRSAVVTIVFACLIAACPSPAPELGYYDGPAPDPGTTPGEGSEGEGEPDEPQPDEPEPDEPQPDEPDEPQPDEPDPPPPDPPTPVEGCERVRVEGTGADPLNVRPTPDTSGTPVGTLAAGEIVAVLDVVEGAAVEGIITWYEIARADELTGFITGRYAACVSDAPPTPGDACGEGAEPTDWTWPMPDRHSVSQAYRNPSSYQTCGFHTGIDVGASVGDPVLAAASGRVVHVGPMWFNGASTGRGPYAIIVQHAPQLYSTYGHNERALVAVGDCVTGGQLIADAGTRGYSSGPHLHFEMVRGTDFTGDWQTPFAGVCGRYEDPLAYVTP